MPPHYPRPGLAAVFAPILACVAAAWSTACTAPRDPRAADAPSEVSQRENRAAMALVPGRFELRDGAQLPAERRGSEPAQWVLVGAAWLVPDVPPWLPGPLVALDGRARAGFEPEPGRTALEQDVRDLVEFLAAERSAGAPPPRIVAQGYQALVAALAAAQSPDAVGGLVLIAPLPARRLPHLDDFARAAAPRLEPQALAKAQAQLAKGARDPKLAAEIERLLLAPRFANPGLARRVQADPFVGLLDAGAALESHAERAIAELGDYDMRDTLAKVRAPTWVVHGAGDCLPRAASAEFADAIPGGLLVVIERSGAFPWIEAPAAFRSLVERVVAAGRSFPVFSAP